MRPLLTLLLVLAPCFVAAADVPPLPFDMPMLMTLPPPPAEPNFHDDYFELSATWTGSGFMIASSGIKQANTASTQCTGSLEAMEVWTIQAVNGVPTWVCSSIGGTVTKGTISDRSGGIFTSCIAADSTTAGLPGLTVFRAVHRLDSETFSIDGGTTKRSESTMTWFGSDGKTIQKTGSEFTATVTIGADSNTTTSKLTTYTGNPGSTDIVAGEWTSEYRDDTKRNLKRMTRRDSDTITVTNSAGILTQRSAIASEGLSTYANLTSDDGTRITTWPLSAATVARLSLATFNDQGAQLHAMAGSRTTTITYTALADRTVCARRAASAHSANDGGDFEGFTRTTTFYPDGTAASFDFTEEAVAAAFGFRLDWSEDGTLLDWFDAEDKQRKIERYQRCHDIEQGMGGVPTELDYPYLPGIDRWFEARG